MTSNRPFLVLATTNAGKVAEFRAVLQPLLDLTRLQIVTPADLGVVVAPVQETGVTFVENARLKALSFAEATGCPALADDSGLCVDALNGAPGLYSARWAGPSATDTNRTALLLRELQNVPSSSRTAHFVCAAALAEPDGRVSMGEGTCHGVITVSPRGSNGFGYDPIFFLPEFNATLAELGSEQKNLISHRARALKALVPAFHTFGLAEPRSPRF